MRHVTGANRQDNISQKAQGDLAYYSPDRRQLLAESLDRKGDCEEVNSRLLAYKHQRALAAEAVAQKSLTAKTLKLTSPGATE